MSDDELSPDPAHGASREMERLLLDVLGSMPGTAITVFDRRLHVLLMSGDALGDFDAESERNSRFSSRSPRPQAACPSS